MDNIDLNFLKRLEKINSEYDEFMGILNSVEVMSDNKLYVFYNDKKNKIEEISLLYKKYIQLENLINENIKILATEKNEDIIDMINQEIENFKKEKNDIFEEMKVKSLSTTKQNQSVVIEISIKKGSFEFANSFIKLIQNMFNKVDVEKKNSTGAVLKIQSENCYDRLKIFNGVLKQTVQGEESVIQVVVLNNGLEQEDFKEEDVVVETFRAGGAGGQHINKTESAIRLKHIPTGITCECQDQRSQIQNKQKAMDLLRKKITQNYKINAEKNLKKQREALENAIFSSTPVFEFDFDKNQLICLRIKKKYDLDEILKGNTKVLESDLLI